MKTTPWRKDALIYMPKKKKKEAKKEGGQKVGYVQGTDIYPLNISMNDHIRLRTIRLEQDFRWGQSVYDNALTVEGVKISSVPYYTDPSEQNVVNVCSVFLRGEHTFAGLKRYNAMVRAGGVSMPNVFGKCFVFDYDNAIAYDVRFNGSLTIHDVEPAWDQVGRVTYQNLNTIFNLQSPNTFAALEDIYVDKYSPTRLDNIESSGLGAFARSKAPASAGQYAGFVTFLSDKPYTEDEISDIACTIAGDNPNRVQFTIQQYTLM